MRSKKIILTNFTRAIYSESYCIRPDTEKELIHYIAQNQPTNMLTRGTGLSYSDSCLNQDGLVIDTSRFNHFIDFDVETGIVVCQGGTPFRDLFLLHDEFIPPVLPGTVFATVAGGIAHDVHGKNNHSAGSFGHHISWFDLLIGDRIMHCSREKNTDLFSATIAGLGLTGIITQVAIRLKKAPRLLAVQNKPFASIHALIEEMGSYGLQQDYQVAWLDLLYSEPRAILSTANYCESPTFSNKKLTIYNLPQLPFGLIKKWNMKLFNHYFYSRKKENQLMNLTQYNNPLDKISHWNRLYGPRGLIQFQAVFDQDSAIQIINHIVEIIRVHNATPTLTVLKLFTQPGVGLLSFCRPGFTLAIDFINNSQAQKAISSMNQFIVENNGRIYLAKDLLLSPEQYSRMYENQSKFSQVLTKYQCPMRSDLAIRLGIIK
ncbi:FAD-binding oxidoreductase [Legionella pneumophila]|uniref:Oxidoreductase (L-gululonolactone oxidase) n=1 Tax=Legionella pneumophila subsp. pascullei TaxID=91890 RepID=A0AAX2IWB9_LEGPN|nr:FAD-binding oxidoreductase [Legionella pneumophila]AMP89562.1 L-gululonolactone oxidase [Legionella pneumophila subsp. pascullei]AMP92772.1 L-gululonolactone oxidase [Legionella pneumophila subsp. pascullei]AMP95738.1 L-gululonolactone oxidase [Legionella pneumophila subsp. pascullei]SQG90650.1 oxidoreductase (L-gululonolactone oxidase) [Legionella pneumophila subsp. pascullei]VEH07195.1 oxidoreductase (L-gululonolactone oxidase) [Legionella pneumophila subsp. pascullei]